MILEDVVAIVPVGGKSEIVKPLAMAKLLNIPVFVVFDADTNKIKDSEVNQHKEENRLIQGLLCANPIDEWPDKTVICGSFAMWKTNLAETIKEELGSKWDVYKDKSETYYGKPGGLNKNPLAIARALEAAWKDNIRSNSLLKLIENINAFATNSNMQSNQTEN